jgi:hypothetical protein
MGSLNRYNPFSRLRKAAVGRAVRLLTKPLLHYSLNFPNDLVALRRYIRKGDVVLVEGNERISECIKYLTQSSWSHSALFVGDEPLRRNPMLREAFKQQYGEDAEFLMVEALVESGVVLSPLGKYADFNLRVCRPYRLSASDLREVLDEALSHVGDVYDIKNVVDLARYFMPLKLVPRRLRHHALHFGSGEPTRVICSSLIAGCFERVGFPVIPRFAELPARPDAEGWWRLHLGARASRYGVMMRVSSSLVTPRDFDVSPYFDIIKFNVIENFRFDYHRIPWAEDQPDPLTAKKQA